MNFNKKLFFVWVLVSSVLTHDNPSTKSSTSFNSLHKLQHVRHKVSMTANNSLLTLHSQLDPLARIVNAIYLEQVLLQNAAQLDTILVELLNINDEKVLKQLEALEIGKVTMAVTNLENEPEVLVEDVETINDGLKALEELESADNVLDKMPSDMEMKAYEENVLKCLDFHGSFKISPVVEAFDYNELSGLLKRQDEVTADTLVDFKRMFKQAVGLIDKVATQAQELIDFTYNPCAPSDTEKSVMKPVIRRARLSKWYEVRQAALNKMSEGITDLGFGMAMLENSIKGQGDYSEANKQVQEMKSVIRTLQAQEGTVIRNFTAAFPEGAADLELVSSDLNREWIHKQIGSSDLLRAALRPLKPLALEVRQVQSSLYAISVRSDSFSAIETVEKTLSSLENAKKSLKQLPQSVSDVEDVGSQIVSVVPYSLSFLELLSKVYSFTSAVSDLQTQVQKIQKSSELQALVNEKQHIMKFFENYDTKTLDDIKKTVKDLKSDEKTQKYVAQFDNCRTIIKDIDTSFSKIKIGNLSLFADDFYGTVAWAKDDFPSLVQFLDHIKKKSSSFKVLRLAINFLAQVKRMKNNKATFALIRTTSEDFAVAIEHLKRARHVAQQVGGKKRAEVEHVSKYDDSAKLAKVLGDGSQLVGELGKALARKEELENVVKNVEAVGQEIQKVKNPKVKSDIEKGWADGNKIRTAVKGLVDAVAKLGEEIPSTGASDLNSVATYLDKLKTIENPGISVKALQEAVRLLNSVSSNTLVTETAVALSKLADLNLDFAARPTSLSDVSASIQSLDKFLKGLDAKYVAPTSTSKTAAADSKTSNFEIIVFLGITATLLIVFDFLLFFNKRTKRTAMKIFKKMKAAHKGLRDKNKTDTKNKNKKEKNKKDKTKSKTSTSKPSGVSTPSKSSISKTSTTQSVSKNGQSQSGTPSKTVSKSASPTNTPIGGKTKKPTTKA